MNTVKMSYKGMLFEVNPSSIETNFKKKIETRVIPFGFGKSAEVCRMPATVSGGGMLCGKNAGERAFEMMRVFEKGGASYLYIPKLAPIKAYFTDLSLRAKGDDCIEYTFTFTEECTEKKSRYAFGYTYARNGENLYDISNRCAVGMDELFAANDYMDMFSVREGDKVWLR